MGKHSTRLRTKNGRIALFKNSPLSVTGIGGAILFRNVLMMSSFIYNIAMITDRWFPRNPLLCVYSTLDLITTRITRLACGFSDFIDGAIFKRDAGVRHAFGNCPSASTECRFYQRLGKGQTGARDIRTNGQAHLLSKGDPLRIGSPFMEQLNEALLNEAIHRAPKKRGFVIIDADSTVIPCYGDKDEKAFCGKQRVNGYYPLMVFINQFPAWIQNAPGATDGRHLLRMCLDKILKAVIDSGVSPDRVLVRTDAGFNADDIIQIIEKRGCRYILGLGQTKPLLENLAQQLLEIAPAPGHRDLPSEIRTRISYHAPKELQLCSDKDELPIFKENFRICGHVDSYRARSWTPEPTVIYRIEHSVEHNETDFRFIQTNLTCHECVLFQLDGVRKCRTLLWNCPETTESAGRAVDLYDGLYCGRGNCELWIREFKESWEGDRMNTSDFFANWYLMFLAFAGMAFLRGWLMSKLGARGWTMRLKTFRQEFLFIPALIKSKARQVEFHVSDRDSKWWSEFDSLIP